MYVCVGERGSYVLDSFFSVSLASQMVHGSDTVKTWTSSIHLYICCCSFVLNLDFYYESKWMGSQKMRIKRFTSVPGRRKDLSCLTIHKTTAHFLMCLHSLLTHHVFVDCGVFYTTYLAVNTKRPVYLSIDVHLFFHQINGV